MLEDVKAALSVTTNYFDAEITANIEAAKIDLTMGDVDIVDVTNPVTANAIKTYCGMMHQLNHGSIEKYEALRASYEMQKKNMGMKTGFTEW